MGGGYLITVALVVLIAFPIVWPLWWALASLFDGSHRHGGGHAGLA